MRKIYATDWQSNPEEFNFVYDFMIEPPKDIISKLDYYVWLDKYGIGMASIIVLVETGDQLKKLQTLTEGKNLFWKEIDSFEEYEKYLFENYTKELHIPDHELLLIELGHLAHLNIQRLQEKEELLKNQENHPEDLENQ